MYHLPWLSHRCSCSMLQVHHGGQGIIAQPPCQQCNGNETQQCHGQHDHGNRTVDIPHVPHLHTLPNWGALGGCSMENVPTIHISKRWVTGEGLRNKVLWVILGPRQVLALRYNISGMCSLALRKNCPTLGEAFSNAECPPQPRVNWHVFTCTWIAEGWNRAGWIVRHRMRP